MNAQREINEAPAWYALAVRSRCEKSVAQTLQEQKLEHFLPLVRKPRLWSDRVKNVEVALFPGYIFVRCLLTPLLQHRLRKIRDVLAFVGYGKGAQPARIADHEIDAVQKIVRVDDQAQAQQIFQAGVKIRVVAGSLRGIEGVVERSPDGHHRLYCNISLLGRSVRTKVLESEIIPI